MPESEVKTIAAAKPQKNVRTFRLSDETWNLLGVVGKHYGMSRGELIAALVRRERKQLVGKGIDLVLP